ncbi:UNVERIFIED_CONTAM: hypothetical protein POZ17_15990 [Ralstonia mannitolilytica]
MRNLLKIAFSLLTITICISSCTRDNSEFIGKEQTEYPYYNYMTGRYYAPKNYYKNGGYWGNDGYYYRSELYYYYDNDVPYYFEDNDVSKLRIYVEKHWGDSMYGVGVEIPTKQAINSFILPE